VIFNDEMVGGRERVTTDEERVLQLRVGDNGTTYLHNLHNFLNYHKLRYSFRNVPIA